MDWISVIISLIVGGTFGALAMGIMSGRAYEKGREDAEHEDARVNYNDGFTDGMDEGYRLAYSDHQLATALSNVVPVERDQVVFEGPDHTKEDEQ